MSDLIEETRSGRIVFHGRYWKDVSSDAKDFVLSLLQPDHNKLLTSEEALNHIWLTGTTATDFNLLPEFRAYMAKARLKRGIEIIKLANRIESLKMQAPDDEDMSTPDIPQDSKEMAGQALSNTNEAPGIPTNGPKKSLSKLAKGAIFREVVLAKVREEKEKAERGKVQAAAEAQARGVSPQPPPR